MILITRSSHELLFSRGEEEESAILITLLGHPFSSLMEDDSVKLERKRDRKKDSCFGYQLFFNELVKLSQL